MGTPADPNVRIIQRVRDLHPAGPDGLCVECRKPWPCPTNDTIDGDPPEDPVATAMHKLRTAVAGMEAQPPANKADLRKAVLDALKNGDEEEPEPEAEQPKPPQSGPVR